MRYLIVDKSENLSDIEERDVRVYGTYDEASLRKDCQHTYGHAPKRISDCIQLYEKHDLHVLILHDNDWSVLNPRKYGRYIAVGLLDFSSSKEVETYVVYVIKGASPEPVYSVRNSVIDITRTRFVWKELDVPDLHKAKELFEGAYGGAQ